MKKLLYLLSTILLLGSCSSEQNSFNNTELEKAVEVVDLNSMANTRSSNHAGELTSKVLKFRDEASYEAVKNQLDNMGEAQKMEWFKSIGFRGAYTELTRAEKELDSIFDIEDENKFLASIVSYKAKYAHEFVFNDSDTYDMSPYLPFSSKELELVGNVNGMVIVGNRVIKPTSARPQYYNFLETDERQNTRATLGPIEPKYFGYKESSMMIKQGKYQSTVQLGVDRISGLLMIQFASQKKKKLWKRRHNCDYTVTVNIGGHIWDKLYQANEGKGLIIKFLLPYLNTNQFNGMTECSFKNFHSGACPNADGNHTFSVLLKGR